MSKLDEIIEELLKGQYIKSEIENKDDFDEDEFQEWVEFEKQYTERDIKTIARKYAEWYAIEFAKTVCKNIADSTAFTSNPIRLSYLEQSIKISKLPKHD